MDFYPPSRARLAHIEAEIQKLGFDPHHHEPDDDKFMEFYSAVRDFANFWLSPTGK